MKRSLAMVFLAVLTTAVFQRCKPPVKQETATTSTAAAASQIPPSSVAGAATYSPTSDELIYVPDFPVILKGAQASQTAKSDLLGRYRFYDVAPGKYTVCWETAGWQSSCTAEVEVTAGQSAYPEAAELKPSGPDSVAWGTVRLADGSVATQIDRSSGTEDVPSVEVLDANGGSLAKGRTNAAGKYAIGVAGAAAAVRVITGAAREELRLSALAPGAARGITLRNHRPQITSIEVLKGGAAAKEVVPGETITLRPRAADPDGDALEYKWQVGAGTITATPDGVATWQLPPFPAMLQAYVIVSDGKGGSDRRVASLNAGGPVLELGVGIPGTTVCSPFSRANIPPPFGDPPTPPFLTFGVGTDNSQKYYDTVDPQMLRLTLGNWWKAAGFNATNGSGGIAKAPYLNWNDLGFGRDMHFNQVGKNVYAWVTNYGCPDNKGSNADLAAKPIPANALATVCMEYAPVEGQAGPTQPIVKFFVYAGGVTNSKRMGTANLDTFGFKPVPNLCQVCHGGPTPYNGGTNVNLGASFLPFDLALLRFPPGGTPKPPTADYTQYFKMNQAVKATKPTAAITALVNGWYTPLNSPPTQINNYVPTGWKGGSIPASAAGLYQNVIVPGCRTCHYSLSNSVNWDTYQSVVNKSNRTTIQLYVCKKGPFMPHAAITYLNFWQNRHGFPKSPPQFLGAYTDVNWPSFGGCTGL
jgi:hypothetical protein